MTTLAIAAALLTLASLVALLWPLLRPRPPDPAFSPDLAIYRDQLAEIERDRARGLIRPEEAAAARLEVERRLLKAASRADGAAGTTVATGRGRAVLIVAAIIVPVLTGALYLHLGAPTLPDQPLAARGQELADGQLPQVQAMVAGLEKKLAGNPDDRAGWVMLGRSKAALEDLPGAVAAYRRALALAPADPETLGGLAETLVAAEGGTVTPEARDLLARLRAAAAGDPRPGFYLGLAAAQAGDRDRAVELWRELLASAPAGAPWLPRVATMIRSAGGELGVAVEPLLAGVPPPPLASPPAGVPAGPSAADAAAVERMSPDDRNTFIRGMVDKLEAKLAADGSDAVGWLRLAQARLVLDQTDEARAAFERGLALHPDDAGLLKGYANLLLGPPPPDGALPEVGDRAAEFYARAAAQAPDDPESQWFLGVRALQEGKPDEARERWRRVLARLEPSQPDYALVKQQLDRLGG